MKVYSQEHSLRYNLQPEFQPISTPGTWTVLTIAAEELSCSTESIFRTTHVERTSCLVCRCVWPALGLGVAGVYAARGVAVLGSEATVPVHRLSVLIE